MELIKPGLNIPFTKYRHIAVVLSSIVNLLVLVLLFTQGPRLGVDFSGGTVVQLKFMQKVSVGEVRTALGQLGTGDTVIQDFGGEGSNEFLVRLERTSVEIGALGEHDRRAVDLPEPRAVRGLLRGGAAALAADRRLGALERAGWGGRPGHAVGLGDAPR